MTGTDLFDHCDVVDMVAALWLNHADQAALGLPGQVPLHARAFVEDQHFAEVGDIIATRCSMCHARAPLWDGMIGAPKAYSWKHRYASSARDICLQSAMSHAMPPANLSIWKPRNGRWCVNGMNWPAPVSGKGACLYHRYEAALSAIHFSI